MLVVVGRGGGMGGWVVHETPRLRWCDLWAAAS